MERIAAAAGKEKKERKGERNKEKIDKERKLHGAQTQSLQTAEFL
jgi:hypothetical protein